LGTLSFRWGTQSRGGLQGKSSTICREWGRAASAEDWFRTRPSPRAAMGPWSQQGFGSGASMARACWAPGRDGAAVVDARRHGGGFRFAADCANGISPRDGSARSALERGAFESPRSCAARTMGLDRVYSDRSSGTRRCGGKFGGGTDHAPAGMGRRPKPGRRSVRTVSSTEHVEIVPVTICDLSIGFGVFGAEFPSAVRLARRRAWTGSPPPPRENLATVSFPG